MEVVVELRKYKQNLKLEKILNFLLEFNKEKKELQTSDKFVSYVTAKLQQFTKLFFEMKI